MSAASEIRGLPSGVSFVPFVVHTTSPLTVYLAGDTTTAVPALVQGSESPSVGDTGMALWVPPAPPFIFIT